jgi:predicted DNA-binding WGR domain protein
MKEPTLTPLLGRYEYRDEKSDKFWQIKYVPKIGQYLAEWGRNGRPPQDSMSYSGADALKTIREKVAKGYRLVKEEETVGDPVSRQDRLASEAKERVDEKRKNRKEALDFMAELKKL